MEIPHRRRRCHAAWHLSDGGRLRRDDHTHHRHGCLDFRHCHLVHGNPGELQFHDGYDCHDLHGEAAENRRVLPAYKNVDTPFGSAWLAKFYTMRQKALVFGPDAKGEYLYFWLTKDGHVGYLGYSFIEDFIKKKLTTPVYPIHEDVAENLADHLSYHSDLMMFQSELKANLEHFVKNGTVQPFQKISASQIYTFTEDYRLTGQHFDLEDTDGNLVYEIDSTVPLKTFYIYDAMHTEIFRMTKELLHALPTYRFYL